MRPWLLLALACAPEPMPLMQGPPVQILVGQVIPGEDLTVRVAGVPSGASLQAGASLGASTACDVRLLGQCSDLASPALKTSATATNGEATLSFAVPPSTPVGTVVHVQVAGRRGASQGIAPAVQREVPFNPTDGCVEDLEFMHTTIEPLLQTDCAACHVDGSPLSPPWVVAPDGDVDHLATNWATMLALGDLLAGDGTPLLLSKPTGNAHTGGQRFAEGDQAYADFWQLVQRTQAPGGCVDPGAPPPSGSALDIHIPDADPPSVRRLTTRELANSYAATVGLIPTALERMPPDSRDAIFGRVSQAQTVSPVHVEVLTDAAAEAADRLLAQAELDTLAPSCADSILPPATPSTDQHFAGISLARGPEWSMHVDPDDPTVLVTIYAPMPFVQERYEFPEDGRYRIGLEVDITTDPPVTLLIDDVPQQTWVLDQDSQVVSVDLDVSAGAHTVEFRWDFSNTQNTWMTIHELTIEGPLDVGAVRDASARSQCIHDLIDALAPVAWRRPITTAERQRLRDAAAMGRLASDATGMRVAVEAILRSPFFAYLVEIGGPPVDARAPLTPHELAARLSYALCEMPPDATLAALAADGTLLDPTVFAAQVDRLLLEPCGQEAMEGFYSDWLHLDTLASLNRDPDLFPDFSEDTRAAMTTEVHRYLHELTYNEGASIVDLYSADHTWVDAVGAGLYGLGPVTGVQRVSLPPERLGLLTQPGILALTSSFTSTSPVRRGIYVLDDLLCIPPPPPPEDLEIVPPQPADAGATTRERWAAHSSDPVCASCHTRIDPVGFAFEEFDALGRLRTEEFGRPVDATGGIPDLGHPDGSLVGGAALAAAVSTSDQAAQCFATRVLRFGLSRMETTADSDMLLDLATTATDDTLLDAIRHVLTSDDFRHREVAP